MRSNRALRQETMHIIGRATIAGRQVEDGAIGGTADHQPRTAYSGSRACVTVVQSRRPCSTT